MLLNGIVESNIEILLFLKLITNTLNLPSSEIVIQQYLEINSLLLNPSEEFPQVSSYVDRYILNLDE